MITMLKSSPRFCLMLLILSRGVESAIPIAVMTGFLLAMTDLPRGLYSVVALANYLLVIRGAMIEAARLPVLIYFRIWESFTVVVCLYGLAWISVFSFVDWAGISPSSTFLRLGPIMVLSLILHALCARAFYTITPEERIAWVSKYFVKLKSAPIRWHSELLLASYRVTVLRLYLERLYRVIGDGKRSVQMSRVASAGGSSHARLDPEGFFSRMENQLGQIHRIFESVA